MSSVKDKEVVTVSIMKKVLDEFYNNKLSYIEELVKENKQLKEKMERLEDRIEELETYSRRNNIVVYGIPNKEQENPLKLAVEICEKMGVKIEGKEIDAAHRIPSKKNSSSPPFILKFVSRFTKEELLKNVWEKKPKADILGGSSNQKLFFNEHLTKKNLNILMSAKHLRGAYSIWTRNGHVLGRKREGLNNPTIQLRSVEQVKELETIDKKAGGTKRTLEDRSPKTETTKEGYKKTQSEIAIQNKLNQFRFENNQ